MKLEILLRSISYFNRNIKLQLMNCSLLLSEEDCHMFHHRAVSQCHFSSPRVNRVVTKIINQCLL